MDSSGLGALVRLNGAMGASVRLQIIDGPEHVQRVFSITGLRTLLPFAAAADALGDQSD